MISVVLAIHNEEKNLARCLDSVKNLADEIIIADGQSTDKSVEIAQKYKAKIIHTTNKSNFHINKQLAMDKAKNNLVFQLDADEVLDQKLFNFIKKIDKSISKLNKKQLAACQPKAWWIKRKNLFLGRWLKKGGQYPDPVIRLYINGYAKLPQKDVHEQMQVNGQTAFAQGHLLHFFNPTFSEYLRKFQIYTSFKAQQLRAQNLKINFKNSINYLIFKPVITFLSLFIRHKGFVDGWPGFIFALFSGLHHFIAYLKLWEIYETNKSN